MHREALGRINWLNVPAELCGAVVGTWDECVASGIEHGYRNAQVTVLAPTGTIAFMMDCDTTGIEPDLALVKYKRLVGGGLIKIVNNVVPAALLNLGYNSQQAAEIVDYIDQHGTIEGSPHVKGEHLPVFDCSLKPTNGGRSIPHMGHIRMMAAVQPFLSGAISKTVNMPEEASPEEIANVYQEAWRLGLKAIAIYRDGSKRSQPLSTTPARKSSGSTAKDASVVRCRETAEPMRHRLPDERKGIVHHFSVGGHEGYLMVGLYEDGQPGEIFI